MSSLQKFIDNQVMVQQDSTSLIQLINFMRAKRPEVYRHSIRVGYAGGTYSHGDESGGMR